MMRPCSKVRTVLWRRDPTNPITNSTCSRYTSRRHSTIYHEEIPSLYCLYMLYMRLHGSVLIVMPVSVGLDNIPSVTWYLSHEVCLVFILSPISSLLLVYCSADGNVLNPPYVFQLKTLLL